jgi:porphyrinogen peroxidase
LLDFSFAKTGNLFFVPSATFLENVGNDDRSAEQKPAGTSAAGPSTPPAERDGSLAIGSLKGDRAS